MTTMTAPRLLLRCCLVLSVLSYSCIKVNGVQEGRNLLRGAAEYAPRISRVSLSAALHERRLKHHDDEDADNNDAESAKDDIMDTRPVISTKAAGDEDVEEVSLDVEKAEEVLEEEEEAATPTPAPHHHSHHDDDDKKDKKKDKATPESTPGSMSPSPTKAPKDEKRASPADNADGNDETATTKAPGADDDDEKKESDTEDTNKKDNEDEHEEEEHGNDDFDEEATDDVPAQESTEHTKKPITPTDDDDDDDKTPSLDDDLTTRNDDELEEELHQEETEAKVFGGFGFIIAIVAMIFTAHQMSENPDGIYASICRLAITIVSCVVKAILMPFRSLFGHRYHGSHMQLSTTEPYRSHAMELT